MIKIPFAAGHLDQIEVREHEKETWLAWQQLRVHFETIEKMGTAMTMVHDDKIITCAGYWVVWPGVCEVWQIPSIHVASCAVQYGREMRRYIKALQETFNLHRIQTNSPHDLTHIRWMTFLGFKCEGELKQYTMNKENYLIWARIF